MLMVSSLDSMWALIKIVLYGAILMSFKPSAFARSVVMPLGMQVVPRSIPASGTFFYEHLISGNISEGFLPPPLIQGEQLSVTHNDNGERMYAK